MNREEFKSKLKALPDTPGYLIEKLHMEVCHEHGIDGEGYTIWEDGFTQSDIADDQLAEDIKTLGVKSEVDLYEHLNGKLFEALKEYLEENEGREKLVCPWCDREDGYSHIELEEDNDVISCHYCDEKFEYERYDAYRIRKAVRK